MSILLIVEIINHHDQQSQQQPNRQQLNDNNYNNLNKNNSDDNHLLRNVGGSALLGSAIGAIAGFRGNRNIFGSVMLGAIAFALGGAITSGITSSRNNHNRNGHSSGSRSGQHQNRRTRSRSSSGEDLNSSASNLNAQHSSNPPTHSSGNAHHIDNNRNGRSRNNTTHSENHELSFTFTINGLTFTNDPTTSDELSFDNLRALEALFENNNHSRAYDDDSENNRGCSASTIRNLPTTVIEDIERDIPSNSSSNRRECSICLEEFKNGDKRKTLPCSHGFHEACIDTWLEGSRTCPFCKSNVE